MRVPNYKTILVIIKPLSRYNFHTFGIIQSNHISHFTTMIQIIICLVGIFCLFWFVSEIRSLKDKINELIGKNKKGIDEKAIIEQGISYLFWFVSQLQMDHKKEKEKRLNAEAKCEEKDEQIRKLQDKINELIGKIQEEKKDKELIKEELYNTKNTFVDKSMEDTTQMCHYVEKINRMQDELNRTKNENERLENEVKISKLENETISDTYYRVKKYLYHVIEDNSATIEENKRLENEVKTLKLENETISKECKDDKEYLITLFLNQVEDTKKDFSKNNEKEEVLLKKVKQLENEIEDLLEKESFLKALRKNEKLKEGIVQERFKKDLNNYCKRIKKVNDLKRNYLKVVHSLEKVKKCKEKFSKGIKKIGSFTFRKKNKRVSHPRESHKVFLRP